MLASLWDTLAGKGARWEIVFIVQIGLCRHERAPFLLNAAHVLSEPRK